MSPEMNIARVNFKEAKQLADLASIVQDLGTVMQTCSRLKKLLTDKSKDHILIESLWTSALIRYARCFTSGKRFGLTENIFQHLPGKPIKVHKFYRDMRDKHIAHSVNPFEQIEIGLILSPQNSDKKEILGVLTLAMRHISSDIDGVHQLGCLAKVLLENVCSKAKDCQKKVLEIGKQMDIEELRKTASPRLVAPGPDLVDKPRG